jgi:hypothetical protein
MKRKKTQFPDEGTDEEMALIPYLMLVLAIIMLCIILFR